MQPRASAPRGIRLVGFSLVGVGLAFSVLHCDRGATGVDACRRIEAKRCEASVGCTDSLQTEEDVIACRLFYRDQCLFGMADGANPDDVSTEACLAAIEQASSCKDAATMAECASAPPMISNADPAKYAPCTILVAAPQYLTACSFLLPPPPEPASGGSGGTSASAGGSGGTSASAGGSGGTSASAGGSGGSGGSGGN